MTNVNKLKNTNFLMWSRQVRALLDGYDRTGYVDDTIVVLPPTVTNAVVTNANPDYKIWTRSDRLIYSTLLGAISDSVQPLLSTTNMSAEIWSTLQAILVTPSRSHVQQLEKIFAGLPEDYNRVVDQLEGRKRCPYLSKVLKKLIHQENKLKALIPASSLLPVFAHAVKYHGKSHNSEQSWPSPLGNQTWQQRQFPPRSSNIQSRGGYQGRCQLCGVHGHSAKHCS
ncbi:PREDICTED: uncharacterized protein LOC104709712 [Camelina sativa]|uniref:Uncharacterized protein LOC104709712 n=1 Tax=Camelina sativa TaxID=90675 RepID=A0ABM0TD72_CAMSA|nr:PREDICTED: uncharacterized protein LOC104709712 [Camelina sativa]